MIIVSNAKVPAARKESLKSAHPQEGGRNRSDRHRGGVPGFLQVGLVHRLPPAVKMIESVFPPVASNKFLYNHLRPVNFLPATKKVPKHVPSATRVADE